MGDRDATELTGGPRIRRPTLSALDGLSPDMVRQGRMSQETARALSSEDPDKATDAANTAISALIEINRENQRQATIRQGRTVKLLAVAVVAVCMLVAAVAGVTYTVTRSTDGAVTVEANPETP